MRYGTVVKAKFIDRPNRFIAHVYVLEGTDASETRVVTVHVKNTGRCRELLVPGCLVYLEKSDNPERKTPYDLIAVEKKVASTKNRRMKSLLINMDSQAPNKVAGEWISQNRNRFPEIVLLKPEFTFGNSRFDFYIEYKGVGKNLSERQRLHKMFLEVKGCTLESDGLAKFPDAPTERGVKHVRELTDIRQTNEYECGILILIQMKGCHTFMPNVATDPNFGEALETAVNSGVELFVVDCKVTSDTLVADKPVEYRF